MANLNRFLQAQDDFDTYRQALQEMKAGRKTSHWVWFIFPQLKGLGRSYQSNYYGIESLKEAEDYLADPVLGKRLREITSAVLSHRGDDINVIMGGKTDAMKFRSSRRSSMRSVPETSFPKRSRNSSAECGIP